MWEAILFVWTHVLSKPADKVKTMNETLNALSTFLQRAIEDSHHTLDVLQWPMKRESTFRLLEPIGHRPLRLDQIKQERVYIRDHIAWTRNFVSRLVQKPSYHLSSTPITAHFASRPALPLERVDPGSVAFLTLVAKPPTARSPLMHLTRSC